MKEGMDFYCGTKNAGERFVSYLSAYVPLRTKTSQKLISENVKNNPANLQASSALFARTT